MSLFEATGHIGLPYLYLGCGFAKKALFFYFSSSILCDAESTTTDNIVFRKPTRPSLPLRKVFFSNPSLSIVFTTPSVPPVGDRNLREEEETALLGAVFSNPSVSLSKGSSTSSPKPPPPQKEGDVTAPPRSSNRYAIRLADHQRSAPGFCAGWDRLADLDADSLLLLWLLTD